MSFLFVDSIVELVEGEYVKGIKHVTYDDLYLSYDWEDNICFPSALIGETLGQLAAWNVMQCHDFELRPVAGIAANVTLLQAVKPGDTLVLESFIDKLDSEVVEYHSLASVNSQCVFKLGSALGPLLSMADFIDRPTVKNQFDQIIQTNLEANEALTMQACQPIQQTRWQPKVHFDFDAILELKPGHSLSAVKLINKSAPYFADHFPLKPVMPMTVLLESQLRLARYFLLQSDLGQGLKKFEIRRAKMNEFVSPGSQVHCQLKLKSCSHDEIVIAFRSEVNGQRVCVAEAKFFS